MKTSESSETSLLGKYRAEIVDMLTEVENWKKELWALNDRLLHTSHSTCSEYGDRMLENKQAKLFYLQRVLRMSAKALEEYNNELAEAMGGSVSKITQFNKYQDYCYKSAKKIKEKLNKYVENTTAFIEKNCSEN